MNKKYTVILKSQLGPKSGTLRIRESKVRLMAILDLLGHKSLLTGRTLTGGQTLELKGEIWTSLGNAECMIFGTQRDKVFRGTLNINNRVYELMGKE